PVDRRRLAEAHRRRDRFRGEPGARRRLDLPRRRRHLEHRVAIRTECGSPERRSAGRYFTAICAYAGVVANWSKPYFVTFLLVILVTYDHRYGTHGATFVIRYLSRFS